MFQFLENSNTASPCIVVCVLCAKQSEEERVYLKLQGDRVHHGGEVTTAAREGTLEELEAS